MCVVDSVKEASGRRRVSIEQSVLVQERMSGEVLLRVMENRAFDCEGRSAFEV